VRSLTRTRLKEFLRAQLGQYATNTVRLMCATLHVVLGEATEDGLLPANPAAGLARKLKLSTKVKARQEVAKKKVLIPTKPITQSERRRSLDPIEAEHRVQTMASGPSRSEATLVRG
jgi:hypothetical protein